MEIPEIVIQLLNTLGLGALTAGLVILYKSLSSRSDTLKDSLTDLKAAHESVVSAMDRRAKQIDERFEDEKKFQNLHMSFLEDVDVLRVKVKAWRDDELTIIQNRLKETANILNITENDYAKLRVENNELRVNLSNLEFKYKKLESQDTPSGVKGLV
jgi:hypothetical protein